MMYVAAIGVLVLILGIWLIASRWGHYVGRLDGMIWGSNIHGLIRFGLDGAFVELRNGKLQDRIRFTVRQPSLESRELEVDVNSKWKSREELENIGRQLASEGIGQGSKLSVDALEEDGIRIIVRGEAVRDYHAVFGLLKSISRHLGHATRTRYVGEFEGPSDDSAVREYFGQSR